MKRIISLVLVMIMLLSMPVSIYADNVENKQPTSTYGDAMLEYLKTDNHKLLVVRGNYGYMQFADDFRQNVFSLYLLEMVDMLIETGTEPDQQKYMEVLINIIATYDLDNATDISEQNSMDNLKTLEDYAMDFVEMGANAVSVMVGNNPVVSEFENDISTAIDRISVLKDNTNDWIEALSDLETIVQSYDKHDRFLELIENNAEGDLKIAASTLRTGMKKAFQIKLDTYGDISDKNLENYSELFFEDVFWKGLKEIPEYKTDKSLKAFVDSGDSFVSKLDLLKSSWELGLGIGKLVGNVTVGGEDLINRVMEILALYDISSILQLEVSELGVEFFETIGTEKEADIIDEYSVLAQYLIGCRVRGEYCLYSIVANDAGLLSWFNKESAEEAKIWYEYKAEKILDIQAELLEVSQGGTEKIYKAYAEKIKNYESIYGVAQENIVAEWFSYMTGLCFAKLIDFEQNGYENLLLVYQYDVDTADGLSREYKFEIWRYENGEMILLDSGELFGTDGGVKHVYLAEVNEKIYLVTGGTDSFGYYYYHGYSDDKFEVVREVTWEIDENGEYVCSINGEPVSYEVLENEEEIWFGNVLEYNLNYDIDIVLEEIEETKRKLGMEDTSAESSSAVKVSEEEAINIAQAHWNIGIGDIDDETGFPFTIEVQGLDNNEYIVVLRWLVENSHWSTVDVICIDATTGACRSYYE